MNTSIEPSPREEEGVKIRSFLVFLLAFLFSCFSYSFFHIFHISYLLLLFFLTFSMIKVNQRYIFRAHGLFHPGGVAKQPLEVHREEPSPTRPDQGEGRVMEMGK